MTVVLFNVGCKNKDLILSVWVVKILSATVRFYSGGEDKFPGVETFN
jgi:hypothetical protein